MNNTLEILKSIYKPYRYTIIGKVTLIETTSGDFIIKEKNKDLKELYDYLVNRGFISFPKLIDASRQDVNIFEYLRDFDLPKEQKASALSQTLASLHNKTCYFKNVSNDTFVQIYESILSNISYLKNYYNTIFDTGFKQIYMYPSTYTLLRSYEVIINILDYAKELLDSWYNLVKDKTKIRVSVVHNNISLNHFIDDKLISWDNYIIDTPVIDLVSLYKDIILEIDFDDIFLSYTSLFELLDYELELFYVLISLPPEISDTKSEFQKCMNITKIINYITKTQEFLRNKKPNQEEEKQTNLQ